MATANVSSFEELKSKIEDTTTTEIIINNDIIFNGGIKVNANKSELVIDFNNHSVIDNNNLSFTNTIYVASTTNTISITVKNATWDGRNYYGVIGVYDGNTNTTITLDNINYIGPQFVYNKNGTTNIKNCYITIDKNNSTTNAQEFCEANRLNIIGNVTVISRSTSDAIIWFTGTNASLTVFENSSFNVSASSTYFLYTDVSPVLLFKKDSSTTITTKNGLFYASGSASHIASSFTLEENASFVAYKQQSNTIPMFKCVSNFTLNKNSTFRLFSEVISSTALMYFGKSANIQINDPKNVVLYNRGGNIFSFNNTSASTPNTININTEMLRLWNIAKSPLSDAGSFSDPPTTQYFKKDYVENINVIAKITSSLTSVDNNLNSEDNGYPMTTSSLKLLTSNVISIGKVTLGANEINDTATTIVGYTNPNANLKISFDEKSLTTTANHSGTFSVPLENNLTVGTIVTISSNSNFLTKNLPFVVVGSIKITKLPTLNFYSFTTNSNKNTIYRQDINFSIEVTDSRASGGNWYLYAYIESPLTSNTNKLEDALIFIKDGVKHKLTTTPLIIYTGSWNKEEKITTISWKNDEGFILNIDPSKTYFSGDYQTTLYFQIYTDLLD